MAKRRIIPLFIPHAGCPNLCVFCDQKKISGATTPVTPAEVRREIEESLPQAGRGCELAFYGGSFTAMDREVQRQLLAAAQPYVQSGDIAAIRLSTRPDAVDDAVCQLLQEYGVTTVELGCQSLDDRVLALSRRGHCAQDTARAVECLRCHGFSIILQMMTGLPGDTGRESLETARKIIALHPDGVRIYPTVVLKGTALEAMMQAGTYQPQSVEAAVDLCATLYEAFLQAEIPIIRLGLNPTQDLSGGQAVAGAYHPALGELVLSEVYRRRARRLLADVPPGAEVVFSVHPSRVSVMVGQRRRNLLALREEFHLKSVKVCPEAQELWEISLKKP
jgi:histone acetyltransferase (RNA polymerase elongator complex component)